MTLASMLGRWVGRGKGTELEGTIKVLANRLGEWRRSLESLFARERAARADAGRTLGPHGRIGDDLSERDFRRFLSELELEWTKALREARDRRTGHPLSQYEARWANRIRTQREWLQERTEHWVRLRDVISRVLSLSAEVTVDRASLIALALNDPGSATHVLAVAEQRAAALEAASQLLEDAMTRRIACANQWLPFVEQPAQPEIGQDLAEVSNRSAASQSGSSRLEALTGIHRELDLILHRAANAAGERTEALMRAASRPGMDWIERRIGARRPAWGPKSDIEKAHAALRSLRGLGGHGLLRDDHTGDVVTLWSRVSKTVLSTRGARRARIQSTAAPSDDRLLLHQAAQGLFQFVEPVFDRLYGPHALRERCSVEETLVADTLLDKLSTAPAGPIVLHLGDEGLECVMALAKFSRELNKKGRSEETRARAERAWAWIENLPRHPASC